MVIWRRSKVLRVGVVGPWRGDLGRRRTRVEALAGPSAATEAYDLLLVTFDGEAPTEWAEALSRALIAGTRVRHVGEYLEAVHGRVVASCFRPDDVGDLPRAGYRWRKPVLDNLLIAVSLPASLLVAAVVGAAIAVTMGPPVLFMQARVGRGGTVFRMVKFRGIM